MRTLFVISTVILSLSIFQLNLALAQQVQPRRPNTVLYELNENVSRGQMQALQRVAARHQMVVDKKLLKGQVFRAKALQRLSIDEESLAQEILATGAVKFAEPDYLVAPDATPNDPKFSSQWHHSKIGSPTAWNSTVGSVTTKVGICDTGIDTDHPDLAGHIADGYNSVSNNSNIEAIHNHGTKVAGVIGAIGNNAVGVAGVNWDVSLYVGRISERSDGYAYYSDMSECIRWAADNGARAVNLSYGGAESGTIDSAAQYLRGKGGLLFIAAGNSGNDISSWPNFSASVLVGATTSSDSRASWSNYGTPIDLVAPGTSIYTTTGGGGYANFSGTSAATPVAVGVAALVFSLDSRFSPSDVENILFNSAIDVGAAGEDNVYGHGRVSASEAIALALGGQSNAAPVAVASSDISSGEAPVTVYFDGTGSYDSDGSLVSYSWNFGDGSSTTGSRPGHTFQQAGTYQVTLTVTDDQGAQSSDSLTIQVTEPTISNSAPVAVASSDKTSGEAPLTVNFNGANSYDSDGSIASYHWNFGDGSTSSNANPSHIFQAAGRYTVVLTVTDNLGATSSDSVTIDVQAAVADSARLSSIQLSKVNANGKGYEVHALIRMVDSAGAPVSGATVSADWSGVVNGSSSGVTDGNGYVTLVSNKGRDSGAANISITAVAISGYSYDAANSQTSASLQVTVDGSTTEPGNGKKK